MTFLHLFVIPTPLDKRHLIVGSICQGGIWKEKIEKKTHLGRMNGETSEIVVPGDWILKI